ncbi:hypothetical protein SAMN05421823_1186 [Catalinimonas alkaloidigena]|uniref:Signal transduction histidine kinase dimerisation/phosphoacceptor domain-containing protein n=1 Tax=Catalinimonas alkaloidigena TaxID=1075417 RepID=A0A1G9UVM8_9BACT|nr:hypothetical protein [Catalinimonas alkaloidigena]SDM63890.1 hypothetical protein SAMN05421823_1186 [Catalinimonas alkaloidigena]
MNATSERHFERQLTRYVLIGNLVYVSYGLVHPLLYGGKPLTTLLIGAAWLSFAFFFYLYQVKRKFETLLLPLLGVTLLFLIIHWLRIGGLGSSIPYGFLISMLTAILLVRPAARLPTAAMFLLAQLVLVVAEVVFHVNWIARPTLSARVGVPITYLLSALILAYLAYHPKQSFDAERQLLHRHSQLLMKQNQLITHLNQALEARVAERTHRLSRTNQQLKEYAAYNSHQVRGPLCRLLGLGEVIKQTGRADPEVVAMLLTTTHELDEVIQAINQTLQEERGNSRDSLPPDT